MSEGILWECPNCESITDRQSQLQVCMRCLNCGFKEDCDYR